MTKGSWYDGYDAQHGSVTVVKPVAVTDPIRSLSAIERRNVSAVTGN